MAHIHITGTGANPSALSGQKVLVATTTSGAARDAGAAYIAATTTNPIVNKWSAPIQLDNVAGDIEIVGATTTATTSVTFNYDNNGNLTSFASTTNTWDYRNRLTQSANGFVTSTYAYDYGNARVKLTEGTSTMYFPTTSYNAIQGGAATTTRSIFADGILIATLEKSTSSALITRYSLPDHLGGTNVVTNASGTIVETVDYYPYGSLRIDSKSGGYVGERRKYIGQEYDQGSQLDYLNARYYNGAQGQFISQDPVFLGNPNAQDLKDPQSLNSYSYAGDNPVTYSDPTGKCAEDGCVVEALAAGAAIGFVGGIVQQGISDTLNHQLSSPGQYFSSAVRGSAIGGTTAALGAAEIAAVLIAAAGAGVSETGNLINNAITHQANTFNSVVVEPVMTGLTAGFLDELPGVPGRYPKLLSDAFFTGEHTLTTAAGEFFGIGVNTFAGTVANTYNANYHGSYNANQVYGNHSITPSVNNGSTIQSVGGGGGTYDTRTGAFVLSGQNPALKYSFSGGKNVYGESYSQLFPY